MIRVCLAAALAATAAIGCTGTETGNPFRVKMALDAHSSDPARVAVRVSMGGAVVDQVWLVLDQIQYVEAAACATDDGTAVEALGAADHARDGATFQELELVEHEFCRIRVPLLVADAAALPAGAPPELAGRSVLLVGRTAAGAPLRVATSLTPSIPVDAVDPSGEFVLSGEDAQDSVLLGFDVAGFLRGVDLDAAVAEPDGTVLVDETHNTSLHSMFEANLGSAMELYRDPNDDGALGEPGSDLIARGR